MTDSMHKDTVHIFNVTLKSNERLSPTRERISNVTIFEVYPIYWKKVVIPGKAYSIGHPSWSASGTVMISGSVTINANSNENCYKTTFFSGCAVIIVNTSMNISIISNAVEGSSST
jgi:hypothetical protein